MQLVLVTQYFDTLKSIGEMDKTNTLFLSHTPGAVQRHFRAGHAIAGGDAKPQELTSLRLAIALVGDCFRWRFRAKHEIAKAPFGD